MSTLAIEHDTEKERIMSALWAWIKRRPGLEFGNYGSVSNYRAELRGITRDKHDAEMLLRSVELASLTGAQLKAAFRAFSGRLSWDGEKLDYCAGQYWPTEYRRAVCAVAACALWDHYREDFAKDAKENESAGDAIRRNFKRLFGKRMQTRWFD